MATFVCQPFLPRTHDNGVLPQAAVNCTEELGVSWPNLGKFRFKLFVCPMERPMLFSSFLNPKVLLCNGFLLSFLE